MIEANEQRLLVLIGVGTIIVHLLYLGLMPLMADEALRAAVAFEMIQTKNFIVPTNWGEFYYRKPPFYNWVIIGFFQLFQSYSLFVFRLPSVIPHLLLGVCTWYVSRRHLGDRAGAIAGFAFVLSGRLLTRDSMLGHIDLLYSLTTFMGFFIVYFSFKRERWWQLFLWSYLLAACGVLMKGLPSILFQGLTLLTWFIYKRSWKKLISWEHASGIGLFLLIVVGYFAAYAQYNSLETYFEELYGQAAMRTVVDRAWYEGVLNLFTFPVENLMHLFPTSLLALFMFKRGIIRSWFKHDFTAFLVLILGVNIIPYWLSPGYYPRYLFMLYPLVFLLMADAFVRNKEELPRMRKVFDSTVLVLIVLLTIGFVAMFFFADVRSLPNFYLWSVVLLGLILGVFWIYFRKPSYRIYALFAALVTFRLAFDVLIIPYRIAYEDSNPVYRRQQAEKVLSIVGEAPLHVYGESPVNLEFSYYIGVEKNTLIERHTRVLPDTYYLIDGYRLSKLPEAEVYYSYDLRYDDYIIHLVRWPNADTLESDQ